MCRARRGGPRTPSTFDANLDCAFVENALFSHLSLILKSQQNRIELVTRPAISTRKILTDIIENEKCFYKVRCMATHQLTKVANSMAGSWDGPPAMLPMFKKMFGSFTASHIIKQNDFAGTATVARFFFFAFCINNHRFA